MDRYLPPLILREASGSWDGFRLVEEHVLTR
ncbi:hypothetical protein L195_g049645, partial [Trifolium pratense]